MASYKEFKSITGQHNVDLSDDDLQHKSDHGWMVSYNQRALCVKMLCHAVDKKHSNSKLPIQCVKFITREQASQKELEYNWPDPNLLCSLDEFYAKVSKHLGSFEKCEIKSDYWNKITNYIELSNYKYKKIHNVECWTTRTNMTRKEVDEQLAQMTAEQKTYISLFGAALKSDMKNGPAKIWMQKLIENLLHLNDDISTLNILCLAPSLHCSTNTELEIIYGDVESSSIQNAYKEPFSSSSLPDISSLSLGSSDGSLGSTESYKRQKIVPGFCVLLPEFPGVFPLVVEFKPACQEPQGFVQNIQQMLSKLFFQDVIFGMVISPRSYQFSLIIKKERNIHFASTSVIRIYNFDDDDFNLDMEATNKMFAFIYSVLKWAKQTNCILEK